MAVLGASLGVEPRERDTVSCMVWCGVCAVCAVTRRRRARPPSKRGGGAHGMRRCMLTHGGLVVGGDGRANGAFDTRWIAVENVTSLDTKNDNIDSINKS